MLEIFVAIVSLLIPTSAVDGLRIVAPELNATSARQHLAASVVASTIERVDLPMVLMLASLEGNWQPNARTYEPLASARAGRPMWSCGVMTPEPVTSCTTSTLGAGYIEGARHWRGWIDACHGNERCAVLGYAGGFTLLAACARHQRVELRGEDACASVPRARLGRALWIRRAIIASSPES